MPPKRKPLAAVTLNVPIFVDVFAFTIFVSTAEILRPYGFYIAGLSISLLLTLSKPWQAHHKKIISKSSERSNVVSLAHATLVPRAV